MREKMANCDTEALSTKLLEALHGTVPHKTQTTGLSKNEGKNKNIKHQGGEVTKNKQNSGTKLKSEINNRKKPAPVSISDIEQKSREKFMFAFDHREDRDGSIRSHSSRYGSSKSERKMVQEGMDMRLPANGKEERLPSSKKAQVQHKRKKDITCPPSDDTGKTAESHDKESPSAMEGTRAKKHFPQSPIENQDAGSFKEDEFISQGFRKAKKMSSDVDRSRKSSSILRHSKRVRIHEDVKMSKINLSSLSPVGTSRTEGTVESHETSEPHIASKNFSQMASVLEGFNTKLKSHTCKKSLEILSSALEKIRLQLQAADSHIQADIGKLTSVGKSKRKRLESSFQEKHERLRLLHDKFKEEVNQQLLDYRTTLEELEAYQLELKGTAERLKASHRKLLVQAEEAVKVQISDADTCILDFTKEAKFRMNSLKQVLEVWIAEGEFYTSTD